MVFTGLSGSIFTIIPNNHNNNSNDKICLIIAHPYIDKDVLFHLLFYATDQDKNKYKRIIIEKDII